MISFADISVLLEMTHYLLKREDFERAATEKLEDKLDVYNNFKASSAVNRFTGLLANNPFNTVLIRIL